MPTQATINKMRFHLCRDEDGPLKCQTVTFAARRGPEVKPEFHTMKIGDCRQLSGKNHYIIRVK